MSCTGIVETSEISGSAEGRQGWFKLGQVVLSFDNAHHTTSQYSVSMDFVGESQGVGAKLTVELTPESARKLVDKIQTALSRGIKVGILC